MIRLPIPPFAVALLAALALGFAAGTLGWMRPSGHSCFIESARPDQQGRFTIRGLPPGRFVAMLAKFGDTTQPVDKWIPTGAIVGSPSS